MKFKCDRCDRPATVHLTEIIDGQKLEKHLCEDCAAAEGITVKTDVPISQLLEDFILQSSPEGQEDSESLKCEVCGLSFSDFRHQAVLGCPNDYDAFSSAIVPLLERAHEGASEHIGKVPQRAGQSQEKQTKILRLRASLKEAIAAEDYERAATLRDEIKELENS